SSQRPTAQTLVSHRSRLCDFQGIQNHCIKDISSRPDGKLGSSCRCVTATLRTGQKPAWSKRRATRGNGWKGRSAARCAFHYDIAGKGRKGGRRAKPST